jgi:hypothetical protein
MTEPNQPRDHGGEHARLPLGSTFGAAAAAYAEHRPDYATAAARWALERAPGPRVLDIGAGTGDPGRPREHAADGRRERRRDRPGAETYERFHRVRLLARAR